MQNSVNHAPGLKCKVCPRLLRLPLLQERSEVRWSKTGQRSWPIRQKSTVLSGRGLLTIGERRGRSTMEVLKHGSYR